MYNKRNSLLKLKCNLIAGDRCDVKRRGRWATLKGSVRGEIAMHCWNGNARGLDKWLTEKKLWIKKKVCSVLCVTLRWSQNLICNKQGQNELFINWQKAWNDFEDWVRITSVFIMKQKFLSLFSEFFPLLPEVFLAFLGSTIANIGRIEKLRFASLTTHHSATVLLLPSIKCSFTINRTNQFCLSSVSDL